MTKSTDYTSIPDTDKGQEERVPFGDDPGFFFRLLATAKKPRMIFYAVGFGIASWWFPGGTLLLIFGLLVVVELGPWGWPRQMIWQGKKAATLHDVITDFLAPMGYRSADMPNGGTIWAGPQHMWKPWRSAPPLYTRYTNGTFILRGDRWALQRLRSVFDSPQFKEMRRQIRRK
jgi:hypothetical protein